MEVLQLIKEIALSLATQTLIMGVVLIVAIGYFFRLIHKRRAEKRYSPLTENMLRMPAQSLERELEKAVERLGFGMISCILPIAIAISNPSFGTVSWLLVSAFSVAALVFTGRVIKEGMQLRLAIDGEQYTGFELNYLMRAGAWVYHDIPFQYGNIDHIVVSTGGVFTVETKTFRKPEGKRLSTRQAKVQFDGSKLSLPQYQTTEPIEQAILQAKYLKKAIKTNLGIDVAVTPIVALPGWFVERTAISDIWVINPKRGGALAAQVRQSNMSLQQAELVANYIESVARSVPPGSKKMDPDASKYYDFWNNRRFEERKIG